MRNTWKLTMLVAMLACIPISAQTPAAQTTPQRAPTTQDLLKLTGCLKMEKDVPGLSVNVAERAGITDDYILTEAKLAKDSPVMGIGVAMMYEIEGITESQLRDHVNHHVEIEGRIGTPGGDGDAPDFNATSLRRLALTCPAK